MPKRSLMLAGGGMKVAFQAGVLQVWLDEAGLAFDHVDGASGGCFNLAMMCQGMSGKQIADNWRTLDPVAGISFNWIQYERFLFAKSIFTLDAYRAKVFPGWGLDWKRIGDSTLDATFNTYNFSRHQLEIFPPAEMSEEKLCACVSLPMWFPPIVLGDDTYIDAVYVTDCNLEEAIRRGADELWVIWTVSETGDWNDGFVNNYFQIIEATANGRFKQICARIDANNQSIAAGQSGEFGRPIELKILRAEVDLNYIVNFSTDRVAEAVNAGVDAARAWCKANGVESRPLAGPVAAAQPVLPTSVQFTEQMKGFIQPGEIDYAQGLRDGESAHMNAMVELTIEVDDIDRFITSPRHEASATGYFDSAAWGSKRPVLQGVFNLLVDSDTPGRRFMDYRLFLTDDQDRPLTLVGDKDVKGDDGSDAWTDTTTLFTRILEGHVEAGGDATAKILGAGIIRIHMLDFLHQLTTFRVHGPTRGAEARALERFGTLFLGKLWDVYARHVLPASPF